MRGLFVLPLLVGLSIVFGPRLLSPVLYELETVLIVWSESHKKSGDSTGPLYRWAQSRKQIRQRQMERQQVMRRLEHEHQVRLERLKESGWEPPSFWQP